jgi:thioredoxin 1
MGLMELTDDNFVHETATGCCLIQFWTPWCGPCFAQEKDLLHLSQLHPKMKFGQINVEENPFLVERYEINVFPTVIILKNGKLCKKIVGLQSVNEYTNFTS